jgi:hypothetical protein
MNFDFDVHVCLVSEQAAPKLAANWELAKNGEEIYKIEPLR